MVTVVTLSNGLTKSENNTGSNYT